MAKFIRLLVNRKRKKKFYVYTKNKKLQKTTFKNFRSTKLKCACGTFSFCRLESVYLVVKKSFKKNPNEIFLTTTTKSMITLRKYDLVWCVD